MKYIRLSRIRTESSVGMTKVSELNALLREAIAAIKCG